MDEQRCPLGRSSNLLSRLFAYRTRVRYLVLKEIKVKSRGTYLGVAWTMMKPLITIVTYFVVFQHVLRVSIPNFLSFFLVGLLVCDFAVEPGYYRDLDWTDAPLEPCFEA